MKLKLLRSTLVLLMGLFCMNNGIFAQGTVKGQILDGDTGEPLIGVKVILSSTPRGAITNQDGDFSFEAEAGTYNLTFSYIGYEGNDQEITITDGKTTNVGRVSLTPEGVGLDEVSILASVAIDRKTPVAVSTISGAQVEALVGNQEFPEILRSTPSIYVTKSGGGFGDARINVRGFDQRNTAVMINGVPVNDMENGWVYWSNWAGLSDVTSKIQVQRGLGASKLAVSSVGGSINIITNAADFKKGGAVSVGIGNDGYQKYSAVYSSGLTESGFAATAQVTHTRGNGYVDGTKFQAYSYFLSLSQRVNDKHTLALTAVGAPQWHHQRLGASRFDAIRLSTFQDLDSDDYDGRKFNHLWGELNGEEFSWRRNFYHKPKIFLNHYWNASDKTSLKTSAYASFGRGGGTGPRGRLRTPGSVFDSFGGFGTGLHDENGQVRFDDLARYNQGGVVDGWGEAKGQFNGQYVVGNGGRINGDNVGSGFIRRASMNYHDWYGVLSTLTHQLSDNFNLVAGIDARYYIGEHFRRVENLIGADAYFSASDDNNPENVITEESPADFLNFQDDTYQTSNNVLAYHNDGIVNWAGLFMQLEYSNDRLTAFLSGSGSNQGFKRIDYFNYLDSDPEQTTDWVNKLGGTVKAGANYNIDDVQNVFVNAGYFSQQPIFDNVFLNFRNDINEDLKNQDVYGFEAGYGLRTGKITANVNLYSTLWTNRQFDKSLQVAVNDTLTVDALATFSGVGQLHQGIELEFTYNPIYNLTIRGMASLANWRYTSNFTAQVTNLDTDDQLSNVTIFAENLRVGDAAQTTFNLSANYEFIKGLSAYLSFYYADQLYADFDIEDDAFLSDNAAVAQLPAYSLLDGGLSWEFSLGGVDLIWRLNVNNIADTWYVAEMDTNVLDDPDTANENEFYTQNRGFWGFGRTWNSSLKVRF